jgi:hypothetical protein
MGAPDIKMPAAPPPAPDMADAAARQAGLIATNKAAAAAQGRKGTFLTQASDAAQAYGTVVPKTLLGQ